MASKSRLANILGLSRDEETILRNSGMISVWKKKRALQNIGKITEQNVKAVREELLGSSKHPLGGDGKCRKRPITSARTKESNTTRGIAYQTTTNSQFILNKKFKNTKDIDKSKTAILEKAKEVDWTFSSDSSIECDSDIESKIMEIPELLTKENQTNNGTNTKEEQTNNAGILCCTCEQVFKTKQGLQRHIERFHSDIQANIECKICGKRFKFNLNLKAHQKAVHPTQAEKCYCDYCGKVFPCKIKLAKHKRLTHIKVRRYNCHLCSSKFKVKKTLDVHLIAIHSHVAPFQCSVCKKCYKTKYRLKMHMTRHSDQQFKCSVCKSKFLTQSNLDKHQKLQLHVHICTFCNKEFQSQCKFETHMNCHRENETFTCDKCGKVFDLKSECEKHVLGHMLDPSALDCSICVKTFSTHAVMKRHMFITHISEDAGFKCKVCGKQFKHSGSFSSHQKVHSSVMIFHCSSCNRSFKWKMTFDRHLLKCTQISKKPLESSTTAANHPVTASTDDLL